MVNSAKRSMAISDLYRMRYVSDPQINSDGNEIMFVIRKAYEEKNTYYSHIWCVSTGGNTPRQLTTGSHQDHTPRWSPDGSLLAFVSDRVKPGSQVYVLPVGRNSSPRSKKAPSTHLPGLRTAGASRSCTGKERLDTGSRTSMPGRIVAIPIHRGSYPGSGTGKRDTATRVASGLMCIASMCRVAG